MRSSGADGYVNVLAAGLALIVLHRIDGGEVVINSNAITSLHMSATQHNKVVPSGAHCVVGLTDGKYVFVTESCAEVRRRLDP